MKLIPPGYQKKFRDWKLIPAAFIFFRQPRLGSCHTNLNQVIYLTFLQHPYPFSRILPYLSGRCMKLKIIIICILFCCKSACFSQQANNWYFGENARITFNTTPPTALLLSQLSTSEGCSSISDNNGNTLFYTNGVTVWTRLNVPMANGTGLMGGLSSTTSSL